MEIKEKFPIWQQRDRENMSNDDVGGGSGELSLPQRFDEFFEHMSKPETWIKWCHGQRPLSLAMPERHYKILYFLRKYGANTHNNDYDQDRGKTQPMTKLHVDDGRARLVITHSGGFFSPLLSFYHGEPKEVVV